MFRSLSVFLLFSFYLQAQPQVDLLQAKQSIPLKGIQNFDVDQFGNLYTTQFGQLLKLDPTGKELIGYANPLLGDISSIDVTNAMNPLIFFDIPNQMVMLDNRLNENFSNTFTDQGFIDVNLISFSDQDHIWFYDQNTDKIYRFNLEMLKKVNQSLNITQITSTENKPTELVTTFEKVYLYVPEIGILIFDAIGAFTKKIPWTNGKGLSISKNKLYLIDQNLAVRQIDLTTNTEKVFYLNDCKPKLIKVINNRIYALCEAALKIYDLPSSKK